MTNHQSDTKEKVQAALNAPIAPPSPALPSDELKPLPNWAKAFGRNVDWTIATAQRHWIMSLLSLFVGSCMYMTRDRTVTWEEEVPLNTGENIVVKRSGKYEFNLYTAGTGHAFFYSPMPRSTIEFTYKGKQYVNTSEGGLQLIAIAPDGLPNLVANAIAWNRKNKNVYSCDPPYYMQFRPSSNGTEWTWPNRIDPWLYKLPTNLLLGIAAIEDDGKKFTSLDRQASNASAYAYAYAKFIDTAYFSDGCIRSK